MTASSTCRLGDACTNTAPATVDETATWVERLIADNRIASGEEFRLFAHRLCHHSGGRINEIADDARIKLGLPLHPRRPR